jgi:hypothetical protein
MTHQSWFKYYRLYQHLAGAWTHGPSTFSESRLCCSPLPSSAPEGASGAADAPAQAQPG